jgi:hypothetical protein
MESARIDRKTLLTSSDNQPKGARLIMTGRSTTFDNYSEAGRKCVQAYVPFVHYVERIYEATKSAVHGQFPEAEARAHADWSWTIRGGPMTTLERSVSGTNVRWMPRC